MRNREDVGFAVPQFTARFSGLPVDAVEALCAPRLVAAIDDADRLAQGRDVEREALSQHLHDQIGRVVDRPLRNRLLRLRRDLYSGKAVTDEQLAPVRALGVETQQVVAAFRDLASRHDAAIDAVRVEFAEALRCNRLAMRVALRDDGFLNGLFLSSPILYGNAERYERAAEGDVGSRDAQIERGLLRYLTRTAMKATPFATLCTMLPGRFDDATPRTERGVLAVEGALHDRRSVVRLNKRIHRVLWERMKRCEPVRRTLSVEPNPTARRTDDDWAFMSYRNGREAIERVACDVVPDRALSMLAGAPLILSALRDGVGRDASGEIDALLESGLLRFINPIPEQTPDWAVPFGALLADIDDDSAAVVHALVAVLGRLTERFAVAPLRERAALMGEMRDSLRRAFTALGIDEWPLADAVVFEDATAAAELVVSRSAGVDDALRRTAEWISAVSLVAPWRAEQAAMRHCFDLENGAGADRMSLLRFHETFERVHVRAHREREERVWRGAGDAADVELVENPYTLDVVRRMRVASDRVMECFWSRWAAAPDALEVDLSPDALAEALDTLGVAPPTLASSSLFGQVIGAAGDDASARVVSAKDHYPIGFGKFHARFLHVMPDVMRQDIMSDNARLGGDSIVLAELCADAFFNANFHPPVLPAEVSCPVVDGSVADGRLSVADLDVIRDPDDVHALRLVHRHSGLRVIPVDVGLVSLRRRTPLYQTMARFCPAGDAYAPLPEQLVAHEPGDPPRLHYRPRFTYAGRVVLSRRRWTVPDALFPSRAPGESELDYFLRVRRWRAEHGIDEQVFAVVQPEPGAHDSGDAGSSRDWRKPQYIDFTSPLLVALFAKLPGALAHFVVELQERYPDAASLPMVDGQRYASELVLQFDSRARNVERPVRR